MEICHLGLRYKTRALIDSGSEGTFISERLFHLLKLPFEHANVQISGLNNTISAKVQRQCSFVIGSAVDMDINIPATALVVPHLSDSLPSHTISRTIFSNLPNIQIDILIGGDIFFKYHSFWYKT